MLPRPGDDGAAGDLTVLNSLFRQVIVNDQRIFAAVTGSIRLLRNRHTAPDIAA